MLLGRVAQGQAFADSGFWDFALLSLYDLALRRVVTGGLAALSELGWTERALGGSARAATFAPTPLATPRGLGATFANLGHNLALALVGCLALALSAGDPALGLGAAGALGVGSDFEAAAADATAEIFEVADIFRALARGRVPQVGPRGDDATPPRGGAGAGSWGGARPPRLRAPRA